MGDKCATNKFISLNRVPLNCQWLYIIKLGTTISPVSLSCPSLSIFPCPSLCVLFLSLFLSVFTSSLSCPSFCPSMSFYLSTSLFFFFCLSGWGWRGLNRGLLRSITPPIFISGCTHTTWQAFRAPAPSSGWPRGLSPESLLCCVCAATNKNWRGYTPYLQQSSTFITKLDAGVSWIYTRSLLLWFREEIFVV